MIGIFPLIAAIVGFCFCPPHTTRNLLKRFSLTLCLSLHPFFLQWYNANCVRHLFSTTSRVSTQPYSQTLPRLDQYMDVRAAASDRFSFPFTSPSLSPSSFLFFQFPLFVLSMLYAFEQQACSSDFDTVDCLLF